MKRRHDFFRAVSLVSSTLLLAVGFIGVLTTGEAMAVTRPAIVRDADNGALEPFRVRIEIAISSLTQSVDLVTVPAGKRLVIEHVSWSASVPTGQQIIFAGLNDQNGNMIAFLNIPVPIVSLSPSFQVQTSSESVKIYLNPGEVVRFSSSITSYQPVTPNLQVVVHGYYVTL
jgi:hypothetical protein